MDSDGNKMYQPTFRYADEKGDSFSFKQKFVSNTPSFALGEKMEIVYDPQHLERPRIFSYWGLFRVAIIVASVALPFLMIGLGFYVFEGYFLF